MQRGSVEANFSLYMVAKRLILPISKKVPEFVLCPFSGVIRAVTKISIIIRFPDDTCF